MIIRSGAVLASGTHISQSTRIYNRLTHEVTYGEVPHDAVVIPGTIPSEDGKYSLHAAIIVKYADKITRRKTAINQLLRPE